MSEHTTENDVDPYDSPVYVRYRMADVGHMHSEPVCAYPDCETYLTRPEMAALQAQQARVIPLDWDAS